MKRTTHLVLIASVVMLAGCGEPIKGIDADAKAAKSQARDAVKAAEDAARRVDELSRAPMEQTEGSPAASPADPQ